MHTDAHAHHVRPAAAPLVRLAAGTPSAHATSPNVSTVCATAGRVLYDRPITIGPSHRTGPVAQQPCPERPVCSGTGLDVCLCVCDHIVTGCHCWEGGVLRPAPGAGGDEPSTAHAEVPSADGRCSIKAAAYGLSFRRDANS